MQGARHAAKNILRRLRGEPTTPFVYRDLGSMAIVGRRAAISDLVDQAVGSDGLAGVAVPAHLHAQASGTEWSCCSDGPWPTSRSSGAPG